MKAKKIKCGSVELPEVEFSEKFASVRISMMIPLKLYKDLKTLASKDQLQGDYKELVKAILTKYVKKNKKFKSKKDR